MARYTTTLLLISFFALPVLAQEEGSEDPEKIEQHVGNEPGHLPAAAAERLVDAGTDLFPAIDKPRYVSRIDANQYLEDEDIVYVLIEDNTLIVFPKAIMDYHHIVNTTYGAKRTPIAVTRCILANTVMIYERQMGDRELFFSTAQETPHGTLVLNDQYGGLWTQMDGYSAVIGGKFDRSFARLKRRESPMTTNWGAVVEVARSLNYSVKVLAPPEEFFVKYSPSKKEERFNVAGKATNEDEAWAVYDDIKCICAQEEDGDPLEFIGRDGLGLHEVDDSLPMHEMGLGIRVHGEAKFYPIAKIEREKLIHDTVGGWFIIVWHDEQWQTHRIFRTHPRVGRAGFEPLGSDFLGDLATGSVWDANGNAILGRLKGQSLEQPIYTTTYWFSWSGYFKETAVYGEE